MTTPEPVAQRIVLRQATTADADAISALVCGLTGRWIAVDCTPEGAARLLQLLAPGPTAGRLAVGYRYALAERGQTLVGVAALRLPTHLYHLFVAEAVQRQGLARHLWQTVQAWVDPPAPVTVNASRYALEVYRKLGFEATGPERSEHGIVFTPMRWRPPG
ncbi:MAG TPA: GNAT family N-acetyltransferase [Lysobacter sp.]